MGDVLAVCRECWTAHECYPFEDNVLGDKLFGECPECKKFSPHRIVRLRASERVQQ